jgi:hypothetical protein
MTYQYFDQLMSGLESLAVIVGICIGGFWAFRKFHELLEKDSARANLDKIRAETEQLDLDRRKKLKDFERFEQMAGVQSVVEISIHASQLTIANDPSYYISAAVKIENKGTRNTRLKYPEDRKPLSVWNPEWNDKGDLQFVAVSRHGIPVSTSPNVPSPSSIIRAGGLETIPFVFRVSSPGLYLLIFSVPVPKEEISIAKKLGFVFGSNWTAKQYVVVDARS